MVSISAAKWYLLYSLCISPSIVAIVRNTAAMWFDQILAAKEPACSVTVFNLK
jgi:hypothetical protein